MSVKVSARVWAESKQSGPHLLMLLAISDFADDAGNAYPSVSTLAAKCRMKPRNANVVLAALKDSGELEIRHNTGPGGTNRYRLVFGPKPLQRLAGEGVQILAGEGMQELTGGDCKGLQGEGVQSLAPLQELAPLQISVQTPAKACRAPLQRLADEPSLNRQEPSRERTRTRKPTKTTVPDNFAVSPAVRDWAVRKGYGNLEQHLEAFVGKAQAQGYVYADWDAAFRNAVRDDWAGLRQQAQRHNPLHADEPWTGAA